MKIKVKKAAIGAAKMNPKKTRRSSLPSAAKKGSKIVKSVKKAASY
mgnify:CR=1 FL=1